MFLTGKKPTMKTEMRPEKSLQKKKGNLTNLRFNFLGYLVQQQ